MIETPADETSENVEAKDSLIGSDLGGRYQVLSAIARGGMGIVYRGRHILMDKIVAIKVLNIGYAQEPGALNRFQHEAKVACQLSHPNIVVVHDFGITDEKLLYLVMDFVEGRTLEEILDDKTSIEVDKVIDFGLQLCDGLEYAHDQNLIHRDLKPSNIMIVPTKGGSEQLKILDFGLAKFVGEGQQQKLSQTGYVMGTGFYMSPEQCRGKAADVRSEIYSVGCVLYEALVGLPPLVGENLLETCQKQIEDTPIAMSVVRPELKIPQLMEAVVNRALEKDPQARFQSAAELRVALLHVREMLAAGSASTSFSEPSGSDRPAVNGEETTTSPTGSPAGKLDKSKTPKAIKIPKMALIVAFPFVGMAIVGSLTALHFAMLNEQHRFGNNKPTFSAQSVPMETQHPPQSAQIATATAADGANSSRSKSDSSDTADALHGDESELFATLLKDAEKDSSAGQYPAAEKLLRKAVAEARRTKGQAGLLLGLQKLEQVLYVQQKFKNADGLDREIHLLAAKTPIESTSDSRKGEPLEVGAKSLESQDDRIAHLAMVCHKNGQCDTAVSLLEHSVAISKRMYGKQSLKTATRLSELASLYMALEQPAKAQPLMEEVMEIKAAQTKTR